MRRESGAELQADNRKSEDKQSGVSGENADNRGLNGKASRELDKEYLSAVESGDMETAKRIVGEAAENTQLKSAEPVTYDDNGNVIPLSERFNSENSDIRYSREFSTEDIYTATDDFVREVAPIDRHSFARSLANKTSGMTEGEIRTICIWSTSKVYVFEADGYMHGEIINSFIPDNVHNLEEIKNEYHKINESSKNAYLRAENVRGGEGRRSSNSGVFGRRRSNSTDSLLKNSSERNSSGDNERIWQTTQTEEEIDEIVNKLRQMYALDSVDNKYSRELDFIDYMNESASTEEYEPTSKRTILANALESTAQNDIELKRLKEYKENIGFIESEEEKLNANRAEAKESDAPSFLRTNKKQLKKF